MIEDHLEQLRAKLEQASGLPETTKSELLKLVAAVEKEAVEGSDVDERSGAEVELADRQSGLSKLTASVEELEASHPELAASINQVALALSKMGI